MYVVKFPMSVLAFDIFDHAKKNGATTIRVQFTRPGRDFWANKMQRVVYFIGEKVNFSHLGGIAR